MNPIGTYRGKQVFWLDYDNFADQLPEKDWICLAIANTQPDIGKPDRFIRIAIAKNIAAFKAHGLFGEYLHDCFDESVVMMMTLEHHPEIDVMTTWHNDQTLADAFWQCFFATYLPATADLDNIKIVCTDLDGINRAAELKTYIQEFELGWLPSDNVKHEVWKNLEGLTTMCFADERGDDSRKLLEPESKLIHAFYAASHFEAMTIYYQFMDWGTYTTHFEIDKQPYEKRSAT